MVHSKMVMGSDPELTLGTPKSKDLHLGGRWSLTFEGVSIVDCPYMLARQHVRSVHYLSPKEAPDAVTPCRNNWVAHGRVRVRHTQHSSCKSASDVNDVISFQSSSLSDTWGVNCVSS